MTRGAEALVTDIWRGATTREVYSDYNNLTLQITTDALFGFTPSNPEAKRVTGARKMTSIISKLKLH